MVSFDGPFFHQLKAGIWTYRAKRFNLNSLEFILLLICKTHSKCSNFCYNFFSKIFQLLYFRSATLKLNSHEMLLLKIVQEKVKYFGIKSNLFTVVWASEDGLTIGIESHIKGWFFFLLKPLKVDYLLTKHFSSEVNFSKK